MSKKDEFVAKMRAQKDFQGFPTADWRKELNLKHFVALLNGNPGLREQFRAAVVEAKDVSVEEQAAAGLAGLFSGFP